MKFVTKVNYANPQYNSLRCGIPQEIASSLHIAAGDSVKWTCEKNDNGEVVVTVEKLEL